MKSLYLYNIKKEVFSDETIMNKINLLFHEECFHNMSAISFERDRFTVTFMLLNYLHHLHSK